MKIQLWPMTMDAYNAALKECGSQKEREELLRLFLQSRDVEQERRSVHPAQESAAPGRMTMSGPELRPDGSGPDGFGSDGLRPVGLARAMVGWFGVLLVLLISSSVWAQTLTASTAPIVPVATVVPAATAVPVATAAPAAIKAPAATKAKPSARQLSAGSDPAASSLEAYLTRVRLENKAAQSTSGAIWTESGRLTRMSTDVRAMRPHDLISVVVSENLAASTDGTVKNSRATSASSGISGLIGTLHSGNALQNLVNQNSTSALNAQGASASNSSLTTTLGGQVVEVLPNGMLVIEAARQVEFAQQVQTIVLRGLVRPEDISQQNQVLSTAISSLEVQVRGKGIINDYTHRQNALVRFLEWALVF
jgi:flagellar L-ring protein precursor FlgH